MSVHMENFFKGAMAAAGAAAAAATTTTVVVFVCSSVRSVVHSSIDSAEREEFS